MENNNTFIKVGEKIISSPQGLDYQLVEGKSYQVEYEAYTDTLYLKESTSMTLPEKLYVTEEDKRFVDKILFNFEIATSTVGVLLSGTKGAGKTVLTKQLAIKSELPIIIIDKSMPAFRLKRLFEYFKNIRVCIIMDEIDKLGKNYDDNYILDVLDGISSNSRHLFLSTCNDIDKINEYLLDRCGRIRYHREFKDISISLIQEILKSRLNDKSEIGTLTEFINNNFKVKSFDNIVSFVDEVNHFPNDSFENLFADMNIQKKK